MYVNTGFHETNITTYGSRSLLNKAKNNALKVKTPFFASKTVIETF